MPTKSARTESRALELPGALSDVGPTRIEVEFDTELQRNSAAGQAAIEGLLARLESRGIRFGSTLLPTSIKPHFIRRSDNDAWTTALSRLLGSIERLAESLRHDPEFRANGPFSPQAWELIDIDPGYPHTAVVCRPDVIWNGPHIGVLELNADSPAMMLYADVVQELQRELFPLKSLDRGRLTFEHRIPALRRALLDTYRDWGGTSDRPVVAIVDWPGQKTSSEQEQLALELTRLGTPAFVCHPHELELRGGRLLGRGEPIDIVQRRLLFPDVVARRDELTALLTAYREHMACVVNPLRSYMVGCKALLAELSRRARAGLLSDDYADDIADVLPCTALTDEIDDETLAERTRWVLKPAFGSGGAGVVIGRYVGEAEWREALTRARKGGWVVQSYLSISLYRVPLTSASGRAMTPLYANWNPFFFGGKPAGGIARVSSDPVVGISVRGALLPSVLVDDE